MSPDRGVIRLLRAAVFGVACLLLAAAAHTLGGAPAPGPITVGLALIPVTLAALWLSARRRRPVTVTAGLIGAQVGLHVLFHALSGPPEPLFDSVLSSPLPSQLGQPGLPASLPHPGHPGHLGVVSPVASAPANQGWLPDAPMLGWHLLAVVATAWLLAHGEAALWAAAARIMPTWREPIAVHPVSVPRVAVASPPAWSRPAARAYRPRGPPLPFASA